MKCKNCGFDIGDFPFCPACGTKAQLESQVLPEGEILPNEQIQSDIDNEMSAGNSEGIPPKVQKGKKPIILIIAGACLMLALIIALASSGNSKQSKSSSTYSSSSSGSSSYTKVGFTDSELETLACSALYDTLMTSKTKQGVALSKRYNIDSTRYSIGSIKGDSSSGWTVKGTFSLYNDYGEYKKSGTFSAKISSYGYATCTISID